VSAANVKEHTNSSSTITPSSTEITDDIVEPTTYNDDTNAAEPEIFRHIVHGKLEPASTCVLCGLFGIRY